jgi:PAS domain S-box-containing protein
MASALQLHLARDREVQRIRARMDQIPGGHRQSLVNSLWISDMDLLEVQLEGLLHMPEMQFVEIVQEGKRIVAVGKPPGSNKLIEHTFPLSYRYRGQTIDLGTLRTVASLDRVHQSLLDQGVLAMGLQAAMIFLMAAFIFLLFYHLVGRHLSSLATYTRTLDLENLDKPLRLERRARDPEDRDELDQLVHAINEMRENLAQDLTERRKAEQVFHRYECIVSATQDLMAFVDRHYVYQAVNEMYLKAHAITRDELIGHSVTEIFGEEFFVRTLKKELDLALSGQQAHYEAWFDFPGLGRRCVDVTYYPFFNEDKSVSGMVVNGRDITERKRGEEKLRHSQKMEAIGELAGGIAHDFNNILSPILGYTEMTRNDLPEGSQNRTRLEEVLKAARRAQELVRQILSFSRPGEQERKPLQIQLVVKEVLRLLRASLPTTIEIRQDIDLDCGTVLADPGQIHQIVMNLCTNAFHAMRESGGNLFVDLGTVELGSDTLSGHSGLEPGEYIKLSVKDTGVGMERSVRERAFEPYFTTKAIGEGSGMGLAVVHGIVKSHGGEITVYSEIGKGTVFNVYFPLCGQSRLVPKPETHEPLPMGTERILLVDDEEQLLRMTHAALEQLGYRVTSHTCSVEALEVFQRQPQAFDLVITDQTMPKLTGADLARRAMRIRPDIPIVLCTGFSDQVTKQTAEVIGIREFAVKPLGLRQLATLVRHTLDVPRCPSVPSEKIHFKCSSLEQVY